MVLGSVSFVVRSIGLVISMVPRVDVSDRTGVVGGASRLSCSVPVSVAWFSAVDGEGSPFGLNY